MVNKVFIIYMYKHYSVGAVSFLYKILSMLLSLILIMI